MKRGNVPLVGSVSAKPTVSSLLPDRSSAVYEGLRRAIIEQALLPGDRLPEDAIGEQFGVSRTLVRSIRLSGEFHILLAEMTGNALLARYISEVTSRCSLILALYGRPHSSECAVNEHVQLIDALAKGRGDEACRIMEHHIGAVQERARIDRTPRSEQRLRTILSHYAQNLTSDTML